MPALDFLAFQLSVLNGCLYVSSIEDCACLGGDSRVFYLHSVVIEDIRGGGKRIGYHVMRYPLWLSFRNYLPYLIAAECRIAVKDISAALEQYAVDYIPECLIIIRGDHEIPKPCILRKLRIQGACIPRCLQQERYD